jgi:DNA-binding NarL/FixJ family response regulator
MKITIGLVDDERLFVSALSELIRSTNAQFEVVVDAVDGESFLEKLAKLPSLPDIVLVDVRMEGMSGSEVVREMTRRFPLVHKVALSSVDKEDAIIGMLRAGCCAYLLKSIDAPELERALREIYQQGYYNADGLNIHYRRLARLAPDKPGVRLNARETEFLRLACSDLTYKAIAVEMKVAERTVDGYRESLFEKLKVQSRVGMALEAIRLQYVKL